MSKIFKNDRVLTRFAPSPTGKLHVGNVRTLLVNFLLTKKAQEQGIDAKFMLRIDNTDLERSKDEYRELIEKDIKWLGIEWQEYLQQSDRLDRYNEIKQELVDSGILYPCYETPDELETKRKFMIKRGQAPIYDRSALKLTEEQVKQYEEEGRKPHFRFKLEHKPVIWDDLVRGKVQFEGKNLTDPVLFREDGSPTYSICSVIDDGDYDVTHIVRGEDHVSNTATQVQMFEMLGYKIPVFAHIALIKTESGELSKRLGGFDIEALRDEGFEAESVVSYLAKLGTSDAIEAKTNKEIIAEFDLSKFSRNTAIYNPEEIARINKKVIANRSFAEIKDCLAKLDIAQEVDENFWLAVRENLEKIQDIKSWIEICKKPLAPAIDSNDADFLTAAIEHLPNTEWDNSSFSQWVGNLKSNTDRKGKTLFMPIRKALTAQESGPELKDILPLIGREKAIKRLTGQTA